MNTQTVSGNVHAYSYDLGTGDGSVTVDTDAAGMVTLTGALPVAMMADVARMCGTRVTVGYDPGNHHLLSVAWHRTVDKYPPF